MEPTSTRIIRREHRQRASLAEQATIFTMMPGLPVLCGSVCAQSRLRFCFYTCLTFPTMFTLIKIKINTQEEKREDSIRTVDSLAGYSKKGKRTQVRGESRKGTWKVRLEAGHDSIWRQTQILELAQGFTAKSQTSFVLTSVTAPVAPISAQSPWNHLWSTQSTRMDTHPILGPGKPKMGRLRQEDWKFKASLDNLTRLCWKTNLH